VAPSAIVMAAGEGRRLRPVTERYAKPVLPIDGRPVLATLLRDLAAAGIEDVTLVTGHLAEQVEALAGDGSAFGVTVRVVRQPVADGAGDAVRRAVAAATALPALVLAADTVFASGDVGRFAQAFVEGGAAGAMSVRREPPPGPGRAAVRVRDGLVESVRDDDPANPLSGAPLWGLGPGVARFLDGLPGPPYELRDAYERAIEAGDAVAAIEIGRTRDLTDPVDLVEENFPYTGSLRRSP
jgi:NDP-sugar pyrophosphorylase family protein